MSDILSQSAYELALTDVEHQKAGWNDEDCSSPGQRPPPGSCRGALFSRTPDSLVFVRRTMP